MNDSLDRIDALAVRARTESAPRVHVSAHVLARLTQPRRRIDMQMGVLALASVAMAAITIAISMSNRLAPPDPLESMIEISSLLGL